ncbi:MAG: helix-turn-helix transcriptional regulator [Acidimicrobiales bacterium]
MTRTKSTKQISYRWNLRILMAERGMFSTAELVPLLSGRGVVLSREQVYRLVAKVPERLSLTTLAALCDILGCSPAELIEVTASNDATQGLPSGRRAALSDIRPRRAKVSRGAS